MFLWKRCIDHCNPTTTLVCCAAAETSAACVVQPTLFAHEANVRRLFCLDSARDGAHSDGGCVFAIQPTYTLTPVPDLNILRVPFSRPYCQQLDSLASIHTQPKRDFIDSRARINPGRRSTQCSGEGTHTASYRVSVQAVRSAVLQSIALAASPRPRARVLLLLLPPRMRAAPPPTSSPQPHTNPPTSSPSRRQPRSAHNGQEEGSSTGRRRRQQRR